MATKFELLSQSRLYLDPPSEPRSVLDELGDDKHGLLTSFQREVDLAIASGNLDAHREALHQRLLVIAGQITILRNTNSQHFDVIKLKVLRELLKIILRGENGLQLTRAVGKARREARLSYEAFLASQKGVRKSGVE